MKVFISWSGEPSRSIADALRKWLPGVLQAVRPYFSPDDIAKGARWEGEISKELAASRIGLLILTPENTDAPWLLFEAGALAKNLEKSKVCPLLFGIEPTDVKGPLVQFQSAKFEADEIKRVVKMINVELAENGLDPGVLDQVFDMWWPKLETEINATLKKRPDKKGEQARSERDLLEEVLGLTRSILKSSPDNNERRIHPGAVEDLVSSYRQLAETIRRYRAPELVEMARRMSGPIEYMSDRVSDGRRNTSSREIRDAIRILQRAEIVEDAVDDATEIIKTEKKL